MRLKDEVKTRVSTLVVQTVVCTRALTGGSRNGQELKAGFGDLVGMVLAGLGAGAGTDLFPYAERQK